MQTAPKLSELDPVIKESGFLVFNCPNCLGDKAHRIRIPLAPAVDVENQSWGHSGDLTNLTCTPSVNVGCWHGYIVDGTMRECGVTYSD